MEQLQKEKREFQQLHQENMVENMDCKKITAGSTLYLPVNVDGGLLSMGDIHALMGDGEVFICGLETAGEITVKISVLKNTKLPVPFYIQKERL